MRDDFSKKTKDVIARRVGYRCSMPDCIGSTTGPHSKSEKAFSIGEAAHITAASPGGPRYDPSMTAEQRKSADNGIWLCRFCSKMIDSDTSEFTTEVIRTWKAKAEQRASDMLTSRTNELEDSPYADVSQAERFGSETEVCLADGTWVPFAYTFDPAIYAPTYYELSAFVVRFMVAKRPSFSHVLVSEIRAIVHDYQELPEYQQFPGAYPYETSLYLVELTKPRDGQPTRCTAERFFTVTDGRTCESERFSPLLVKDDVPETIDVRLNPRESGMYTVSLDVVITHGAESRVQCVLDAISIVFEKRESPLL